MGEPKRLSLGATQVIKSMIAEPGATWTTGRILEACNRSERAVDQVIEILLGSGAATIERTGGRVRYEHGRPLAVEQRYRLTSVAPAVLRRALEDSWSSRGFVVTLLFEGWEPAKFGWHRRRRSRGIVAIHERHRRPREQDAVLFDPCERRGLGRLYRLLDRRVSRPRG